MSKVGIFGAGWVGLVTGVCFAELGHDVVIRDVLAEPLFWIAANAWFWVLAERRSTTARFVRKLSILCSGVWWAGKPLQKS